MWHGTIKEAWVFPDPDLSFVPGASLHLMPTEFTVEAIPYFLAFSTWKKRISGLGLMSTTRLTRNVSVKYAISKLKMICGNISASTETLLTGLLRGVWQMSLPWNLVYFLFLLWVFSVTQAKLLYYVYTSSALSFKIYYPQRQSIHIF